MSKFIGEDGKSIPIPPGYCSGSWDYADATTEQNFRGHHTMICPACTKRVPSSSKLHVVYPHKPRVHAKV